MKIGIGIDTGGTYTDAVVYDFENRKILGHAKSLTTRHDLTEGILGAIDALPAELLGQADLISLSTTLATNACVEDKGGRAKLIFFGGDPDTIDRYGAEYGLPPSRDICIRELCSDFSGTTRHTPDWDDFERRIAADDFAHLDGVGIIEMNAMRSGAAGEKHAKEIFRNKYDIPVVCGHELFSELNSLQRGATTLLNARLFPVIGEFLRAVKSALSARNIQAKNIVIVRSDGTLMNEEFAALHPVETMLCGPAASTVACAHLTDNPHSLVVDMGGTTTDISLIRDGIPVSVTDGVSIGKWRTFVNGMYVKTIGLGGDSAIHFTGRNLTLEEYRVIPLCIAASRYPSVREQLKSIQPQPDTRYIYEHCMLVRPDFDETAYSAEERKLCNALRTGPLSLTHAAAAVGKDIYSFDARRLIKDGVIQMCGLTPTDIMHIKGDFTDYDAEASRLGAAFVAYNLGISVPELCDAVYDAIKRKLYCNLVEVLLENRYPHYKKEGFSRDVLRFIADAYEDAKQSTHNPLLSLPFRTEYTIVGSGAPIAIFLDDVAKMLGTRALIPAHHEVANALGAIMSNVDAVCSVRIAPNIGAIHAADSYIVYGITDNKFFETVDEAVEFAQREAEKGAKAEALRRGARGTLSVTSEVHKHGTQMRDGNIDVEIFVTAHATGAIGF